MKLMMSLTDSVDVIVKLFTSTDLTNVTTTFFITIVNTLV